MTSPRTAQAFTNLENPRFSPLQPGSQQDPQKPSDFPTNEGGGPSLSLEQARYLQRMNQNAVRQAQAYKNNVSRQPNMSEKEKYAQRMEEQAQPNGAVFQGGLDAAGKNVPLGKYVTQLEMKDPEARRRLKEMLEFQMNEKRKAEGINP